MVTVEEAKIIPLLSKSFIGIDTAFAPPDRG
jgi:hypothetical protein